MLHHLHSADIADVDLRVRNAHALRCIALILAFVAALCAGTSHARSVLIIEGVEGELANNIRLLVAQPPEREQARQFRRYIDNLPEQVVSAMSAYGYYSAQASVSVTQLDATEADKSAGKQTEKAGNAIAGPSDASQIGKQVANDSAEKQTAEKITQITIRVTPNAPVRIRNVDVQVTGTDESDRDFSEILTEVRSQLAKDTVFVSASYESAKSSLATVAQDIGYFDFEFSSAQVKVSRRTSSADITLIATAGERFTFGQIQFKQRTFSNTFMNRWVPFETGDPYQASLVGELTQNLQSSGYFSSVRVRPLIDPRYGKTIPITVDLTQQELNQVSIGVGFSTDTKARTKLTWGKPLINRHGHSAEAGLSLSRDVQSASFAYRIPRSKEPLVNYWGIEYGLKNDELGDTKSFLSTLNFQRVSRTRTEWIESLFIRWQRERFEAGGEKNTIDLLLPGFSYSRSRSKGAPFPVWGQSVSFQLLGGSKQFVSDIDFLKSVGRFRYLRAISDRNTIIATVQYGAIESNDFERVPTSERFFVGGDRTIRGFAFRDISPRNPDDVAVGGRYLEVLNLEYNYRFLDRWSAALFSDAGRAFNNFDTGYSVGAGFGVRWQSPVGPFRIDIATPISDNDGNDIRVHLSLGPDL